MINRFAAVLVAFGLTSPAFAADLNGCALGSGDFARVAPMLAGDWHAANGVGAMVLKRHSESQTEQVPAKGGEDVVMTVEGGKLTARLKRSDPPGEAVTLARNPGNFGLSVRAKGSNAVETRYMDHAAIGGAPACDPAKMLRIEIKTGFIDQEGAERAYDFILHVVDENTLSGVMTADLSKLDREAHLRRLVTFKRK